MRTTLPALLLVATLAGCLGGGGGDGDGCPAERTRYDAWADGLHDAVAARPRGVPADSVDAPEGIDFDDALPWDAAEVRSIGWQVAPPTGTGQLARPDRERGSLLLTGEGRDLRFEGRLPGDLDQPDLEARVIEFLAAATMMEPEERQSFAASLEWVSGASMWSTSADLRATGKMPSALRDEDDWTLGKEAGVRHVLAGEYSLEATLPVEQVDVALGGMQVLLTVDAEDEAAVLVMSKGHGPDDAARLRDATLALVGWDGEPSWRLVADAACP